MKRKKCLAALTAAGVISAMALGMAVTSYAADGWTKTNDHWTYINQGKDPHRLASDQRGLLLYGSFYRLYDHWF